MATRDVFAAFAGMHGEHDAARRRAAATGSSIFCTLHGNDLTPAAIACVPVIAEVLAARRPARLRLARMSGSGATCFGLFDGAAAAAAAAQTLTQAYPDWWVAATTLG